MGNRLNCLLFIGTSIFKVPVLCCAFIKFLRIEEARLIFGVSFD